MKVSVVISAFNEEKKIEECISSVKKIAAEIIVVDNTSADDTASIAKKNGAIVFTRANNPMLNVNKNYGFTKATNSGILCLDADERVTHELSQEIEHLDNESTVNGYFIPRKNIIFGKWIEHTGWYPDPQLRLFKKDKGKFEEKHVHEFLRVEGATAQLENPMLHLNYENISQFLNKMVKTYTVSEAENLLSNGYAYKSIDAVKMPLSEFITRYFAKQGYRDGMHGLILSLLQAFYHFVVFLRLWEANNYPEDKNTHKILIEGQKMIGREFRYWKYDKKITEEKNSLKKNIYKIQRKVLP
jgi:glycosyltransferase involved in cell wall biosynthesis